MHVASVDHRSELKALRGLAQFPDRGVARPNAKECEISAVVFAYGVIIGLRALFSWYDLAECQRTFRAGWRRSMAAFFTTVDGNDAVGSLTSGF